MQDTSEEPWQFRQRRVNLQIGESGFGSR